MLFADNKLLLEQLYLIQLPHYENNNAYHFSFRMS